MGDAVNLAARVMAKAPRRDDLRHGRRARPLGHARSRPSGSSRSRSRARRSRSRRGPSGPRSASRSREGVALRFPLVGARARARPARRGRGLGRPRRRAARRRSRASRASARRRLVEELRERAAGLTRLHATCEAYTTSTPYAAWRELLRPLIGDRLGGPRRRRARAPVGGRRDVGRRAAARGCRCSRSPSAPTCRPRARSASSRPPSGARGCTTSCCASCATGCAGPTLIEIEDAHLMDAASADLLRRHRRAGRRRAVARRRRAPRHGRGLPGAARDGRGRRSSRARWARPRRWRWPRRVTDDDPLPPHVLRLAAERSGGNPQFLRDLLRAVASDRDAPLPDSIETAAMARIDRLDDADRALVRRAADARAELPPALAPRRARGPRRAAGRRDVGTALLALRRRRRRLPALPPRGRPRRRLRRAAVRGAPPPARPGGRAPGGRRRAGRRRARGDPHGALRARPATTQRVWRYARLAGHSAHERLAYADAAQLYRHALDAGRAVDAAGRAAGPGPRGARRRAGAHGRARPGARGAARRAPAGRGRPAPRGRPGPAPCPARRAGRARCAAAVRWTLGACGRSQALDGEEAARIRARLLSLLATLRQRQGRTGSEAIALCRQAIAEAERSGEDAALAHACFILDWALFDSGRPEEATHSARALAIYERLGDLDRQAAVLNNLGGFAYHEGRWDDAVELYRRSRDASERAGDLANAAFGDCNVGEVLSDQGRWDEAEVELRRARRTWRGSGYESEAGRGRRPAGAQRRPRGPPRRGAAPARGGRGRRAVAARDERCGAPGGLPGRGARVRGRAGPGARARRPPAARGGPLGRAAAPRPRVRAVAARPAGGRARGPGGVPVRGPRRGHRLRGRRVAAGAGGAPGRPAAGGGRASSPDRGDVLLRRLQVAVLPSPPLERPASRRASA